jgi:drug/metabolite transporter (DMT)-like permease
MDRSRSALVGLHVAVLLFGTAGLFAKFLSAPSLVIVVGRTLFATLALVIWLSFTKGDRRWPAGHELPLLAGLGVILAVHWWTFFYAIQISTVAIGLLGYAAFPMFVTIAEPILFKERFRLFDGITAAIIMLGLAAVAWPFDLNATRTWGLAWGIFSGLLFALLSLLNRRYVQRHNPITMACFQNGFACLVLLPALAWNVWYPTWGEVILLFLLGLFCTALAHALYIRSLASVRAQLAGIIAALEPVYGIILAFILLDEIPALTSLAGGVLIVGTSCAAMVCKAPQVQASGVDPGGFKTEGKRP